MVENKTGAAGAIGAEMVKAAPADGYTLMFTNSTTMVQNKVLFKKLPYDPDKDFALVAWFNTGHLPTIINKDVPAKNIPEFAAWARDRKVSLATYGAGSYAHVVAETLNRHYGLKMEAVHYRGEALMWQDVASGAVQGASGSYASASARAAVGRGPADRRADAGAHEEAAGRADLLRAGPDREGIPGARLGRLLRARGHAGRRSCRSSPTSWSRAARPSASRRSSTRSASTRRRATAPISGRSSTRKGPVLCIERHQEPEHRAAMSGSKCNGCLMAGHEAAFTAPKSQPC